MVLGERALWRTLLMTTIMKHLGDKVSCNRKDNHKLAILLAQYAEGIKWVEGIVISNIQCCHSCGRKIKISDMRVGLHCIVCSAEGRQVVVIHTKRLDVVRAALIEWWEKKFGSA